MTAEVQMVIVIVIVAAAIALLLRSFAKTILGRKKAGCGSGCGKCATPAATTDATQRFSLPQA